MATCYWFSVSSLEIHLAAICTGFAKSTVIFHVLLLKLNTACQTELGLALGFEQRNISLLFCLANPLEGEQSYLAVCFLS